MLSRRALKSGLDESRAASAWGKRLAQCFSKKFGNDLGAALQALAIRLVIAPHDQAGFPLLRLAVWEGDTRTIRLFRKPLVEKIPDWNLAARRACAHELFHALAAENYHSMPLSLSPPVLSRQTEETAAEAFANFAGQHFRLTLEE